MIFVVCFALEDELRDGVKRSIEKLQKSHIEVKMISGDHMETAKAIAIKAGILLN